MPKDKKEIDVAESQKWLKKNFPYLFKEMPSFYKNDAQREFQSICVFLANSAIQNISLKSLKSKKGVISQISDVLEELTNLSEMGDFEDFAQNKQFDDFRQNGSKYKSSSKSEDIYYWPVAPGGIPDPDNAVRLHPDLFNTMPEELREKVEDARLEFLINNGLTDKAAPWTEPDEQWEAFSERYREQYQDFRTRWLEKQQKGEQS